MFIDSFERLILPEEINCLLGTEARNPRNIIRSISNNREIVTNLMSRNAKFLHHIFFLQELAFHRIIDVYMPVSHELAEILIRRDDHHLVLIVLMLMSDRPDNIICLIPLMSEYLHSGSTKNIKNPINLRTEIVRHPVSLSLVLWIYFGSEALTNIRGNYERSIMIFFCESTQKLRHSEDRIHLLSCTSMHLRDSIEHPIDQIVGIDDKECFFRHF